MKSTIVGSAVSVLLAFSAIAYSKTLVQTQDPKSLPATSQAKSSTPDKIEAQSETNSPETEAGAASLPVLKTIAVPAQSYTATAYSLRGKTASGKPVSRGLIAADTSILPIGTHVWVEAGTFTGEYVVGDTGGSVKGKRIDIWTPTAGEAMRFGRRAVKLTVLSFGRKRAKTGSARLRQSALSTSKKN